MSLVWTKAMDPVVGEIWETANGHRLCEVAATEDSAAILKGLCASGRAWRTVVGRAGAAEEPADAEILLLDISGLNSVISLSGTAGYVRVQSACTWAELERSVNDEGYTLGPLPAWLANVPVIISLQSSGVYRPSRRYGALKDSIHAIQVASSAGVAHSVLAPRRTTGPDFARSMLGVAANAGVLTEFYLQIWPRPLHATRCELRFRNRQEGLDAMWRIADAGVRPSAWCLSSAGGGYSLEIELQERYPVDGLVGRIQQGAGQDGVLEKTSPGDSVLMSRLKAPLSRVTQEPDTGDIWDVSGFGYLVESTPEPAKYDWALLTAQYQEYARQLAAASK